MSSERPRIDAELTADVSHAAERRRSGREPPPFVAAVIGDFRGDARDRSIGSPVRVDRDNVDEVMRRLGAGWRPSGGAADAPRVSFGCLDDLHPDRLLAGLPALTALTELRRHAGDPRHAGAIRAAIASPPPAAAPQGSDPSARATDAAVPAADAAGASVLRQMLEHAEPSLSPPSAAGDDLRAFAARVARPYVVSRESPDDVATVEALDRALGDRLRAVLHDPAFQRLESVWRSVWALIAAVEDDVQFQIWLVQASHDALAADLRDGVGPSGSHLERQLADLGTPPALVLVDVPLDVSGGDLAVLEALGEIGARLGAPVIVGARPDVLGVTRFPELAGRHGIGAYVPAAWREFRSRPAAAWVSVALPQLLLRLPYGGNTDPIDTFDFDEDPPPRGHDRLLWGSPAAAIGLIVARAFAADGWNLDLSQWVQRIEHRPFYTYETESGPVSVPVAEVVLDEEQVAELEALGFTALASYRGADAVALRAIQTAAAPRAPVRFRTP